MNAVERLVAIEELEQLKAKYWYYLDHQDWEKWRDEVWSPDSNSTSMRSPNSR